jgi:hypothetical protein
LLKTSLNKLKINKWWRVGHSNDFNNSRAVAVGVSGGDPTPTVAQYFYEHHQVD